MNECLKTCGQYLTNATLITTFYDKNLKNKNVKF